MEILNRKVKALSLGRIEEGSIGFMTEEDEGKWYNLFGEKETLEVISKDVIAKGNVIEFEFNNNVVGSLKLIEKAPEKKGFGDDMTNYGDLLTAAHKKAKEDGIYLSIESRPQKNADGSVMVDFENKTALYEATLTTRNKEGITLQVIVDTGDAEGIGSDMIKPHFNRMASTRAIARCYRIYTNNASVAVEETQQ